MRLAISYAETSRVDIIINATKIKGVDQIAPIRILISHFAFKYAQLSQETNKMTCVPSFQ